MCPRSTRSSTTVATTNRVQTRVNAITEVTETGKRGRQPGPPPVPFVLAVGVTGHRADLLPADSVPALRDHIREVLSLIAEAGRDLCKAERECFADGLPRMRFVSPIADGADQIAAEVALDLGWELEAILPF